MQKKVAVVYLMWLPYNILFFEDFLRSYTEFKSGFDHDLFIVFNGYIDTEQVSQHLNLLHSKYQVNAECMTLSSGHDIDAYFFAANKIGNEIILFLNTFSRILENGWLEKYMCCYKDDVGLISATASYESYFSSVFSNKSMAFESHIGLYENFRKYKLFLKAFFYWRFLFKSFPNPHLRTNAFMINRKLFLEFKKTPLKSKFEAYQFESGRNSLTNKVLKKGYSVLVIDKFGYSYTWQHWANSKTFWIAEQQNLLIADNQTRNYDQAGIHERLLLTKRAWGTK